MRPFSGRSARACLRILSLGLILSLLPLQQVSRAYAQAGAEPPRYNPAELRKHKFKVTKGSKEILHRELLLANAKKNLHPGDFDKFMDDVSALEEKVRRGKARPHKGGEAIDGDGIPLEVEFEGTDLPAAGIRKTSEFFRRPVED